LEKPAFFKRHAPDKYGNGRGVNFEAVHRAPQDDDSDDETEVASQPPSNPYKFNPLPPASNSSSSTTGIAEEKSKPKASGAWDIEAFEKDLNSARSALEGGKWKPGFLSAYESKKI
jgi:hypothetical protein